MIFSPPGHWFRRAVRADAPWHLPSSKRRELELIVKILFEEFEDALVLATQP